MLPQHLSRRVRRLEVVVKLLHVLQRGRPGVVALPGHAQGLTVRQHEQRGDPAVPSLIGQHHLQLTRGYLQLVSTLRHCQPQRQHYLLPTGDTTVDSQRHLDARATKEMVCR